MENAEDAKTATKELLAKMNVILHAIRRLVISSLELVPTAVPSPMTPSVLPSVVLDAQNIVSKLVENVIHAKTGTGIKHVKSATKIALALATK